jgi:hypothetical protein
MADQDTGAAAGGSAARQAGTAALRGFFERQGVQPAVAGDGRFALVVPVASGEDERLNVEITASAGGVAVRVRAPRAAPRAAASRLAVMCNEWNRTHPAPRAIVVAGKVRDHDVAEVLLEGWLPPSSSLPDDQVDQFLGVVVNGARDFWTAPTVRDLLRPPPPPAA